MSNLRLIIFAPLLFYGLYAILMDTVPGIINDYKYTNEYNPAHGAKITEAKCTNWNIIMFSACAVKFISPDATGSQRIAFWTFGRTENGEKFHLLEKRATPPIFTTDVGLESLRNRAICAATWGLIAIFFVAGFFLRLMHGPRRYGPQNPS
jgi:hypothetical protein